MAWKVRFRRFCVDFLIEKTSYPSKNLLFPCFCWRWRGRIGSSVFFLVRGVLVFILHFGKKKHTSISQF